MSGRTSTRSVTMLANFSDEQIRFATLLERVETILEEPHARSAENEELLQAAANNITQQHRGLEAAFNDMHPYLRARAQQHMNNLNGKFHDILNRISNRLLHTNPVPFVPDYPHHTSSSVVQNTTVPPIVSISQQNMPNNRDGSTIPPNAALYAPTPVLQPNIFAQPYPPMDFPPYQTAYAIPPMNVAQYPVQFAPPSYSVLGLPPFQQVGQSRAGVTIQELSTSSSGTSSQSLPPAHGQMPGAGGRSAEQMATNQGLSPIPRPHLARVQNNQLVNDLGRLPSTHSDLGGSQIHIKI